MSEYEPSTPNPRNLIGIFIFLFCLMLYAFLIAAGGDWLEEKDVWIPVQFLYYLVFGIIWFWPSKSLFLWMARGKKD